MRPAFKIAGVYALFGALWILLSDRAIELLVADASDLTQLQTIKGWSFVVLTALLLFFLVRRQVSRMTESEAVRAAAERDRDRMLTEAIESRRQALESRDRLARVFEGLQDGFVALDAAGCVVFINEAAARVFGHGGTGALAGRRMEQLAQSWGDGALLQALEEAARERRAVRAEALDARLGAWFEVRVFPSPEGASIFLRDVSPQRQAKEALHESERRFRALFEATPHVAVWGCDRARRTIFWNRASEQLFGHSSAEALGRPVEELILPPQGREEVVQGIEAWLAGGEAPRPAARALARKDGSEIWGFVSVVLVGRLDAAPEFYWIGIDLTEQRRAESLLRLQGAALAAAANAIVITDRTGCIEWINPAYTKLTGYSWSEAVGKAPGALVGSGTHDGAVFREMWASILAGHVWQGELTNRRKDGTRYIDELTVTPVRDETGGITHFVGIQQDVSKRKELEAQALRSQRLESVGRLAGGIAHDLNNILAPILIAPALLRAHTPKEAAGLIDTIEESARRGAAIIRQLLTFSRGGGGERVPVDLRHVVREMVSIIRETFPKNITTATEAPPDLWMVAGDATQLHQVLMNLCVNARDSMPGGGRLALALENVELDPAAVASSAEVAPGPFVALTVTDTGSGIPAEHLDRIFDPFFTTKELGRGTGLGLSTALGIVRSHRGMLQVRSRMGEGTQFRVYLPAIATPAERVAAEPEPAGVRGGGELVLVVDDEESVRRVTRRMLEAHGFSVVEAADGVDAVSMFARRQSEIRAVVTDLVMPFMDGAALTQALRRLDPKVKIIAVSGSLGDAAALDRAGMKPEAFVGKPFSADALLRALDDVLRSAPGRPEGG